MSYCILISAFYLGLHYLSNDTKVLGMLNVKEQPFVLLFILGLVPINLLEQNGSLMCYNLYTFLVTEAEFKRLKEAFKRSSNLNGLISKQSFVKDVLGDGVPVPVAEVTAIDLSL